MNTDHVLAAVALFLFTLQTCLCILLHHKGEALEVTSQLQLQAVGVAMSMYQADHASLPSSLDELEIEEGLLKDPVTGERFLYRPDRELVCSDGTPVLVYQPRSFRTGYLPWGGKRCYGLVGDGSVRNVHGLQKTR